MTFEQKYIMADLGTGEFRVSRFVKTTVNRLSELPAANGFYDRVITGFDKMYLLEGEFVTDKETDYFEELFELLENRTVIGAVIGGRNCPELAAVKLVLTRSEDSHLGKYTILLKEI